MAFPIVNFLFFMMPLFICKCLWHLQSVHYFISTTLYPCEEGFITDGETEGQRTLRDFPKVQGVRGRGWI